MNIDKTSIIITLFILLILVVASPAQAAIGVDPPVPAEGYKVNLGDFLEFDITMDMVTDIDSFVVIINPDTDNIECKFDRHGNNLKKDHDNEKACKGIKIRKPGREYGYGYGYGYGGEYKYRVRIETNKGYLNNAGDYTITLEIDDYETSFELTVSDPGNGNNGNSNNNDNDNSSNDNDNGNHGDGNNGKPKGKK